MMRRSICFHVRETDGKILAWSPRKDDDPDAVVEARQAARDEAENEHRRLLYVAMTRAEERLYISGFYRRNEPNALCWGTMIAATRGDDFVEMPAFWNAGRNDLALRGAGRRSGAFVDAAAAPARPRRLCPLGC